MGARSVRIRWKPSVSFEEGLSETVDWYLNNGSR
jgi:dTDP-D-glucose 4,6-dehydratase